MYMVAMTVAAMQKKENIVNKYWLLIIQILINDMQKGPELYVWLENIYKSSYYKSNS